MNSLAVGAMTLVNFLRRGYQNLTKEIKDPEDLKLLPECFLRLQELIESEALVYDPDGIEEVNGWLHEEVNSLLGSTGDKANEECEMRFCDKIFNACPYRVDAKSMWERATLKRSCFDETERTDEANFFSRNFCNISLE